MGKRASEAQGVMDRLPGEAEILAAISDWGSATYSQLITELDLPDDAPSVPQLLEVLIGYGEVSERGHRYRLKKRGGGVGPGVRGARGGPRADWAGHIMEDVGACVYAVVDRIIESRGKS
jgi:hypothetical protein